MLMPDYYDIRDPRFAKLIHKNAVIDTLWTGAKWCEGPAYLPQSRTLIWSDIPNDRLMGWDEVTGAVSIRETPCRNQNGHTVDAQGRLVACEHGARCISRIEHDGRRVVLASHFDGKRLNSPNDVVVKSDGSVWFTDPTYGIDSDYEGDRSATEIGASNVYRIGQDGAVTCVVTDMVQPNGLAFSPDEALLYVADTGTTHQPDCTAKIRAYPLAADGRSLGAGLTVCESDCGLFDGFRIDLAGNIWSSAGDGVHCFEPGGTLLGKILLPEVVANLTFGGRKANRLFVTGKTSLYAVYVNATGVTHWNRPGS